MKRRTLQHGILSVAASLSVLLAACAGVPAAADSKAAGAGSGGTEMNIAGTWTGAITIQGSELGIIVRFADTDPPSGTIDIPAQGAKNLPLSNVVVETGSIRFELPVSTTAAFDGKPEGGEIKGTFRQGNFEGTFRIAKGEPASGDDAKASAADPSAGGVPGSRFREEPVSFPIAGTDISGTLMFPEDSVRNPGPMPVALVIAGSGPTDRNGNSPLLPGRNDSLKLLAEALAEKGVASLRYDKRGVAASVHAGMREEDLTLDAYVSDAAALAGFLAKDARFGRIALVGHSEGSLVALVAAKKSGAAAVVSIAGMGKRYQETLLDQLAGRLPPALLEESRTIVGKLEKGELVPAMNDALVPLFRPSVQPFLISAFRYDPRKEIAGLKVPVLIVQGTADLQVPVESAKMLREANPSAGLAVIENMNHVLKTVTGDAAANMAAYSDPSLALPDEFVRAVTEFLLDNLK